MTYFDGEKEGESYAAKVSSRERQPRARDEVLDWRRPEVSIGAIKETIRPLRA